MTGILDWMPKKIEESFFGINRQPIFVYFNAKTQELFLVYPSDRSYHVGKHDIYVGEL